MSVALQEGNDTTEVPEREDIQKISFNFLEDVVNDNGLPDYFLDNLNIIQQINRIKLSQWTELALRGATYQKTNDGINDIFMIQNSPILQIVVGDNRLKLYFDKNTYVDYGHF
jgi:hypothetical protein